MLNQVRTGQIIHSSTFPDRIEKQPVLGPHQKIYFPLIDGWHALNLDLTPYLTISGTGKYSSPVFSLDETSVFFDVLDTVYAYDTTTGAELWQV